MVSPSGSGQRRLPFTDPDRLAQINATLDLIERGGPFPFPQDGTVFVNKERRLPVLAVGVGVYSEYTVITPGLGYRGVRRIVQGPNGEIYYSDDHFRSFVRIDPRRY